MRKTISTKFLPIKPVEGKNFTHLKLEVFYMKGGRNYHGQIVQGGIKLSVNPCEEHPTGIIVTDLIFNGPSRMHLKDAERWSKKFLEFKVNPDNEKELVNIVLQSLGTELAE